MSIATFCKFCHFQAEYEHFHLEDSWFSEKFIYIDEGQEYKATFWDVEDVRKSDGIFADENKICLPCQTMRKVPNV